MRVEHTKAQLVTVARLGICFLPYSACRFDLVHRSSTLFSLANLAAWGAALLLSTEMNSAPYGVSVAVNRRPNLATDFVAS